MLGHRGAPIKYLNVRTPATSKLRAHGNTEHKYLLQWHKNKHCVGESNQSPNIRGEEASVLMASVDSALHALPLSPPLLADSAAHRQLV